MKRLFIFFVLIPFVFLGCAHQKTASTENPDLIIRAETEEWRSAAPGEDEFTEHGTDLTLELNSVLKDVRFNYIVYNGRKSFPVTVDSTENNTLLVQARIVYKSEILSQTSDQTNMTDRIVFQNKDGETDYIPVKSWIEKPLTYR